MTCIVNETAKNKTIVRYFVIKSRLVILFMDFLSFFLSFFSSDVPQNNELGQFPNGKVDTLLGLYRGLHKVAARYTFTCKCEIFRLMINISDDSVYRPIIEFAHHSRNFFDTIKVLLWMPFHYFIKMETFSNFIRFAFLSLPPLLFFPFFFFPLFQFNERSGI